MAIYDKKPSVLEAVGNGSYVYRYGIEEVVVPAQDQGEEQVTNWQCEEVTVWAPLSSNKIVKVVISSKWDADREQKLINEYNAAQLGMYGGSKTSDEAKAKIQAYKDFLEERAALKAQVDEDWEEYGVN